MDVEVRVVFVVLVLFQTSVNLCGVFLLRIIVEKCEILLHLKPFFLK